MQKSFSHQSLCTTRNHLIENSNTKPDSIDKCSKLKEILEKLPMLRKVSDGSNHGQREVHEHVGVSSASSGSNQRAGHQDDNLSPRMQMSLNRAMFDQQGGILSKQNSIQATPIK